jgi:hypothetical protein
MNKKMISNTLGVAILLTLALNLSISTVYGQIKESPSTQRVPQPGEFSFVDTARAGLPTKQTLQCGAASGNPGWFANGEFIKTDLSFGLVPPTERLGSSEQYIGSWAVRSIFPADATRPETISSIYFDGFFNSGSVSAVGKGGTRGFDLSGSTYFTGSLCDARANYDTRYYVRFVGFCGANQDISFEMSLRPPVNNGFLIYFNEEDIYAKGTFNGSVTCEMTNDSRRVRTELSRRR